MFQNDDWVKYVGLARKAGAVLFGQDNILSARNTPYLVIVSINEASQNLNKKIYNFIANKNIKLIKFSDSLDKYLGTQNCKVIGITNRELAEKVYSLFNKE